MSANRRVVFGASLLGIGTVCFVLMLAPSGESRIVLRMVDRHEAGNGNWIGTFVITNGSDRMVPTFARMSSAGKRGPTDGEPVCWVEPDTVSLGSWQPTWVEYGRILWPTSSWRFQTVIKPTNAPVRLVLTYGLARGRWPRLVENCLEKYYRVFSWPRIQPSLRYVTCELPANQEGGPNGRQPFSSETNRTPATAVPSRSP